METRPHDLSEGLALTERENLITYVYTTDGQKLNTSHHTTNLAGTNPLTMTATSTDYVGNLILKNGHPEMLRLDDGYVSFDSDTISGIHYYIQDYMGNNRIVVNKDGTIEQITHYYPYGGVIGDISGNESLQKFKFEGKELDRTFGLDNYDIHARQYFAMAPMWDRPDKLSEKYYGISPYVYCDGDPINNFDPTGCYIITRIGRDENYTYCIEKQSFVDSDGEAYSGDNDFLLDLTVQINNLCQYDVGKQLVADLVNSSNGIYVGQSKKNGESSYSDAFDSNIVSGVQYSGTSNVSGGTAYTSLGHEFAHARDRINGVLDETVWMPNMGSGKDAKKAEISATFTENLIRVEHGLPLRVSYYQNMDGSPDYSTSIIDSKGRSLFYDLNGTHLPGFKRVEKTKRYKFIKE